MAKIRKAIAAALTTGTSVYGALALSGGHTDQLVALAAGAGAGLVSGLITYFVPNAVA